MGEGSPKGKATQRCWGGGGGLATSHLGCPKVMYQDPVEDLEEFPMPPHSIAPVQETLHGCQPVTQEDGKESRISVQERV